MRRPFGILADRINAIEPERIKIPAVVKGELLVGAEKSKRRNETLTETLAFLMPYEIVPFEDSMLMTYAKIRASLELRGQKIGYNDTIIAATVSARKGILLTYSPRLKAGDSGINKPCALASVLRVLLRWLMPQPFFYCFYYY